MLSSTSTMKGQGGPSSSSSDSDPVAPSTILPMASTSSSSSSSTSYPDTTHPQGAALTIPSPPAEVESTLWKLTSHKNVTGVLILTRPEGLIIRSAGKDFDVGGTEAGERSERLKRIVRFVKGVVLDGLAKGVEEIDEGDELSFIRIRTKKYEMMISPSDKYLLVVLQDPTIPP